MIKCLQTVQNLRLSWASTAIASDAISWHKKLNFIILTHNKYCIPSVAYFLPLKEDQGIQNCSNNLNDQTVWEGS